MAEVRRVAAARGWQWVVQGWRTFLRAPAMWVLLTLVYLVALVAVEMVPVIGALLMALVTPGIYASLLAGARAARAGEPLEFRHLVVALTDPARRGGLITLGAISVAVNLLVVLLAAGTGVMGMAMMHQGAVGAGALVGVLLILTVALVALTAFVYAAPLVYFGGEAPVAGLKLSIQACIANIGATTLAGLVLLAAMLVLVPVTFGLALLVLLPVTVGAVEASYEDVFGPQGEPPELERSAA